MQPIYLAGHSRPVRKVAYNYDGDLLFTCSDDQTVCMYRTYDCARLGVFNVKEAVKGFDLTKDSSVLITATPNHGVQLFKVADGSLLAHMPLPGSQAKQVRNTEFSLGEKQYLVVYEWDKVSYLNVYDFKKTVETKDCEKALVTQIILPKEHTVNQASWGPLNKTIYAATASGKMILFDVETQKELVVKDVHQKEIFSFEVSYDHTMLVTCSKDNTAKLLHPRTFETVRVFNFIKPCRSASISPLFDSSSSQKFHVLLAGGQDAQEVTTTAAQEGGFAMRLMSIIYGEQLAEVTGHFGTVHCVKFSPDGSTFASGAEDGYVHFHKMLPEYYSKKFE